MYLFLLGHWIGDPCEFTQMMTLCLPEEYDSLVQTYGEETAQKETLAMAVSYCFSSTVAQAHNQGSPKWSWLLY